MISPSIWKFGTKERFDALQIMFFHLRKNGVDCKIFTNNGWGNLVKGREKDFQFFLNIARVFDPQMKDDDIIYGNRNKVKTFKENADLMKAIQKYLSFWGDIMLPKNYHLKII